VCPTNAAHFSSGGTSFNTTGSDNFADFTPKLVIDRVAGEIIRLVASVCVRMCVSIRLSVGALLFEPFDL